MRTPPKRDYNYLRNLDVNGWYVEISRLCQLSAANDLKLCALHERIIFASDVNTKQTSILHVGGPYLNFVVNAALPDAPLEAEFRRWLRELRKQLKPHLAKPGPRSNNAVFDDHVFERWISTKIVEYADLLVWRATLSAREQKKWNKTQLGLRIGRLSIKDVNTTERILKQALMSLPSLGAQVEHNMTQGNAAETKIAAHIAKHIALNHFPVIRRIMGEPQ